jgi:hypothetical protein
LYDDGLHVCSNVGAVLLSHHGLYQVSVVANQMRLAATTAVYRKSLRLSSSARFSLIFFLFLPLGWIRDPNRKSIDLPDYAVKIGVLPAVFRIRFFANDKK